jgi:hypothetical protein
MCLKLLFVFLKVLEPDPHLNYVSGSGLRRKKCTCSLLRPEAFSCSYAGPYGVLGISKLQIMIQKNWLHHILVIKTVCFDGI